MIAVRLQELLCVLYHNCIPLKRLIDVNSCSDLREEINMIQNKRGKFIVCKNILSATTYNFFHSKTIIMKTLFICVITVITFVSAPAIGVKAQNSNDSVSQNLNYKTMATQYLKKSHDQRVTSIVLAGVGTAMAFTGVALALAGLHGFLDPNAHHNDYGSAPDVLGIGGSALIVAAVPFAIASRTNKKKARLYMSKETVAITPGKTASQLVSLGIKIGL